MNTSTSTIGMPVLGEQSTRFYLDTLNTLWAQSSALPVTTMQTDFERINAFLPDNYSAIKPLLGCLIEELENGGFSYYLVPNITLHAAIDRMELPEESRGKLIHALDIGLNTLQEKHINEITLVGTRHTMTSDQLLDYFEPMGISVQFPPTQDIELIDNLRLEVFAEGFTESRQTKLGERLSGYENPVIACSELSVLNTDNAFIDLARLQINKTLSLIQGTD